jgi:CheY-like chemotaxis protein/HPt (histidine-containing phosphotransfer) domain-containing protein
MTKVQLSEEEISEFKIEAEELLDQAEQSLLDIDKGSAFAKGYDAIFRAFHSVKGAAGMLNWENLQHHMHQLETHFQNCKNDSVLSKQRVTYFLNGVDGCRKILDGNEIVFIYELPGAVTSTEKPLNHTQPSISKIQPSEEKQIPTGMQSGDDLSKYIENEEVPAVLAAEELDSPAIMTAATIATESPTKEIPKLTLAGESDSYRDKDARPLVFVIDDEPDIVDILSDMLESSGYRIKGFTQANEAISSIEKLKPQAVFTDMNMPEMTGFEVLKKVHTRDPDLPVIFVSAHLTKQLLIDALSFGVFGAIEKPFNDSQILNICRIATKRYQLWSLLNRSINFVLYQYSGLEEYLASKGLHELKDLMVKEMQALLDVRRQLREEKEKSAS